MGLIFRRTRRGPAGSRVTVSSGGVSVSKRFGPLTISSSGRITLRILPGLSWRIR